MCRNSWKLSGKGAEMSIPSRFLQWSSTDELELNIMPMFYPAMAYRMVQQGTRLSFSSAILMLKHKS